MLCLHFALLHFLLLLINLQLIILQFEVGRGYEIKFLKGQVLSYVDKHNERIYISCERRYQIGFDYLRFTNNVDYSMLEITANLKGVNVEFVKQLIAFSHWTFQVRILKIKN